MQSLGAKFVELPIESADAEDKGGYAKAQDESFYRRQREMMLKVVAGNDVVITTALIPGKKAPILLTTEMVEAMAPGSVVVDLAAERGGNCELTRPDEVVHHKGVTIIGPSNPPALVPYHASQMYSKNIITFLTHLLGKTGAQQTTLPIDTSDEITRETLLTRDGAVVHPRVRELSKARRLAPDGGPPVWMLRTAEDAKQPFLFRITPGNVKTVGRAPRADFVVDAALVSRLHCRLAAGAGEIEATDLEEHERHLRQRRAGRPRDAEGRRSAARRRGGAAGDEDDRRTGAGLS